MVQAVRALADPEAPHLHRKTQGAGLTVAEKGGRQSTLRHHICAQINQTNGREQSGLRNPGLQQAEIKPQTSN